MGKVTGSIRLLVDTRLVEGHLRLAQSFPNGKQELFSRERIGKHRYANNLALLSHAPSGYSGELQNFRGRSNAPEVFSRLKTIAVLEFFVND